MRPNLRTLCLSVVTMWSLGCGVPENSATTQTAQSSSQALSAGGEHGGQGHHHGHQVPTENLTATVVATGIPGAGAIAQVGEFHRGNPVHEVAVLKALTQPGEVLDGARLLVASTSNFGAPLARPGDAPGSIVSIDISSNGIALPSNFAAAGDQATALGGQLKLYTAQSPNFLNSVYAPNAVTAAYPAVSLPTGISINNGGGRPWFSNAPNGSFADGTITVIDPDGRPLKGGPSAAANGVFLGNLTNYPGNTVGLTAGAVGTALMTKSPDTTLKAVFAAALADGSIAQVHVLKGVDALAPAWTIVPLPAINVANAESTNPWVVTRAGMAFNWAPTRILYVADPYGNRIAALDLTDDGVRFHQTTRYLTSSEFNIPVDVAPSIPEVEADNFASNSTLGAGADLFVLNRGNNTIVRVDQDGNVMAKATISAPISNFRVNGLATSPDGRTLWVTAQTPNQGGVVLKVPAFGAGARMVQLLADATAAGAMTPEQMGTHFFNHDFDISEGVGPMFNGQSCATCHMSPFAGGMGVTADTHDFRVGRMHHGEFQVLQSGPVTRQHSDSEIGGTCNAPTGAPANASIVSTRSTMTLVGTALLDDIDDFRLIANMNAQPAAVRGHPNYLSDGRIGRFGWKAHAATLVEFMGDAFRDEMGVTNPIQKQDINNVCGANTNGREIDATPLVMTAKFLNTIDPPVPTSQCLTSAGATHFQNLGCATCHTPSFPGPGRTINAYTDLLLHDMGPGLADQVVQESASGSEFRTMPLWKLSDRSRFLHDARATTVEDAIIAHGGQAAQSAQAFLGLSAQEKQELMDFLNCI